MASSAPSHASAPDQAADSHVKVRHAEHHAKAKSRGTKNPAVEPNCWMEAIYTSLPGTPLTDVVIPGTHNSGTACMTSESPWALGADQSVPQILRSLGRSAAYAWSRCQSCTVLEQLEAGIRFLDLRVAPSNTDESTLHVVHGLVCAPLQDVLNDVATFARKQPREIVLIKRTLMWELRQTHPKLLPKLQKQMDDAFESTLGDFLLPVNNVAQLKFQFFWKREKSVAIIDEGRHVHSSWQATHTHKMNELEENLHKELHGRKKDTAMLHELSAYLTPRPEDIVQKSYSWLFNSSSNQLESMQKEWCSRLNELVQDWHKDGLPMNIVSTDFFSSCGLVDTAIELNKRTAGAAK